MAWSTCPKCNYHNFEVVEKSLTGSDLKFAFVQCIACGTVVGVIDHSDIGHRINELEKRIDGLQYHEVSSNI
ncbi:MAG TPA: hypothetical protein VHP38_06115 [Ruminiclostridium sp.]|nr:hypothetical protein [Ruminiclostridium sp.]